MMFQKISTLDELAQFLGYADYASFKGLVYPTPYYKSFKIPKKNGGERLIETPGQKLKIIQRKIALEVAEIFGKRSPAAHSFIRARSVVTNALPHVGRASVIRVDLADFFHQIHFGRVKGVFLAAPFSFPPDVATVLAHICSYQGRLPQGAPTSPAITNFMCVALDRELRLLAKRYKGRYTRYADDLTFSFTAIRLEKLPPELFIVGTDVDGRPTTEPGPLITSLIRKHGFAINPAKTRGTNREKRQMVTGIVVNNGLALPARYCEEIRRALFIWSRFGLAEAEKRAIPVLHRRRYASGVTPSLFQLMRGKLTWLAHVIGRSGLQFQRLASQYNSLVSFEGRPELAVQIDPRVQNIEDAIKATWYVNAETHGTSYEVMTGTALRFKGNVWITCAHCISDFSKKKLHAEIYLSSGDWSVTKLYVRVVDVDWSRDLAVLRPIPMTPLPRNLAYFEPSVTLPAPESKLGILGFPSSKEYQPPIFMRARTVRVRGYHGVSRIEIDKPILSGNSGGPVFDENYRLLGIVVEGATVSEGMNSCIAVSEFIKLKKY